MTDIPFIVELPPLDTRYVTLKRLPALTDGGLTFTLSTFGLTLPSSATTLNSALADAISVFNLSIVINVFIDCACECVVAAGAKRVASVSCASGVPRRGMWG